MAWYDQRIKGWLKGSITELLKADGVDLEGDTAGDEGVVPGNPNAIPDVNKDPAGVVGGKPDIGRKAIIDDPYFEQLSQHVIYKGKMSRLSNRTLKDVSVRDWLVCCILQCRVDTLLRFGRPEHFKFKEGFKVIKRNPLDPITEEDREMIRNLEEFIQNCGRTDQRPKDDQMLFSDFLKVAGRDALTFGHVAIEKVKTRKGGLHRFRVLPAESVYLINKKMSKDFLVREYMNMRQVYKPGDNDPRRDQVINEANVEYYKYVQMSYDNRPMAIFGDEDMIFKLFNPQNFADSNGYCYSPLEFAIINITNHLNVENYNANFFTHGYAARGILHLKGTVTQSQLMNFRRQFFNTISGQQHAWRTPIVAGLDEVQWVPMSASAREMEYINFNNHLLRTICAQFQIDPVELGLDYLISANGRAPMQQANNEYKIAYSRERGLYPLFMYFEDMINGDIIPAIDPALAEKYKFVFTGYTDETAQTEIAQMQAEMTVWKSMNDLLVQSQKNKMKMDVADLPMNQAFWALVEKNMTKGEIREQFFGDKGATQRRELAYFPGDPAFLTWQQSLLAIDAAKDQKKMQEQQMGAEQQQAQQDKAAKDHDSRLKQHEHDRKQEAHESEQEQVKANAAHNAVLHGNPQAQAAQQTGATSAQNVGGTVVANPLNKLK